MFFCTAQLIVNIHARHERRPQRRRSRERGEWGEGRTIMVGINSTSTPAPSIIIIIGFLNIASTLKLSRGTKKSSRRRAASTTGYGSVAFAAGLSGVPAK